MAGEVSRGQISQISHVVCQIYPLEASWEHTLPLLRDLPQLPLMTKASPHVPGPHLVSHVDLAGESRSRGCS